MRTTGIQVSGFGFLLRRLELALVIGDPRMAHDPLRSQRRAIIVGVLVSLLIAGTAVMLGVLRPEPRVGDARLVVDEAGTLHVRLEDAFHPVTNVASARLVLREPAQIQQSTAQQLAEFPQGEPLGVAVVPGLVPAPARELVFCEPGVVFATQQVRWHRFVILHAPGGTWLVVGSTRFLIDATVPRALGVEEVAASDELVEKLTRGADIRMPTGLTGLPAPFDVAGRILFAGQRAFMAAAGGVAELEGSQRRVAEALSMVPPVPVSVAQVLQQPSVEVLGGLPREDVQWSVPQKICVGDQGVGTPMELEGLRAGNAGDAAARSADGQQVRGQEIGVMRALGTAPYNGPRFVGPRGTAAVRTEHGIMLISDTGQRFGVGSAEDLHALGFTETTRVSWRVVSALPDAGLLSEANARAIAASISTSATTAGNAIATE